MKKLIAILLALILCFSLCGAAFAAPVDSQHNDVIINVEGVAGEPIPVYSVTFQWQDLNFTYDFKETAKTWDPAKHEFVTQTSGTADWNKSSAEVTVVNHSSAAVRVSASFGSDTSVTSISVNGVTAALSNAAYTIPSAVGTTPENAPKGVTTVNISGAPADRSGFTLGTILVSVGAAP